MASSLDISLTSGMTSNMSLNYIIKAATSSSNLISEYENRNDSEDDEFASRISYEALSAIHKKVTANEMQPS